MKQIRRQIEETTSDYDREKLQERLAKLAGGVAVINVGAATETEMKEKKARVEDALHATRAAVEEGIVPGGGVALLRAAEGASTRSTLEGDEKIGVADRPPRHRSARSAQLCRQRRRRRRASSCRKSRSRKGNEGYNVATGEYEDLVKAGVVDPTKVTRTALQNAASIAGLLLTTECIITELPEKERPGPRHAPGRRRHGLLSPGPSPQSRRSATERLSAAMSGALFFVPLRLLSRPQCVGPPTWKSFFSARARRRACR